MIASVDASESYLDDAWSTVLNCVQVNVPSKILEMLEAEVRAMIKAIQGPRTKRVASSVSPVLLR
jgi:hypothetical protein